MQKMTDQHALLFHWLFALQWVFGVVYVVDNGGGAWMPRLETQRNAVSIQLAFCALFCVDVACASMITAPIIITNVSLTAPPIIGATISRVIHRCITTHHALSIIIVITIDSFTIILAILTVLHSFAVAA